MFRYHVFKSDGSRLWHAGLTAADHNDEACEKLGNGGDLDHAYYAIRSGHDAPKLTPIENVAMRARKAGVELIDVEDLTT